MPITADDAAEQAHFIRWLASAPPGSVLWYSPACHAVARMAASRQMIVRGYRDGQHFCLRMCHALGKGLDDN